MSSMLPDAVTIGMDVGSISVKVAAVSRSPLPHCPNFVSFSSGPYFILRSDYRRTNGEVIGATCQLLRELLRVLPAERIHGINLTGTGGRAVAKFLEGDFENEFRALSRGVSTLHPEIRTVFEMGGDNAKYLRLEEQGGSIHIADYEKNGDCAAGTGSFMDQQATRLQYPIEEVGKIVLQSPTTTTIAGRCSVFAKSDMIHAQQKGHPPPAILKGLCEAVVRNFKSSIVRGKAVVPKALFIGGVAANEGVVEAMRRLFELSEEDLIITPHYAWYGAIGAALLIMESYKKDFSRLTEKLESIHDGVREPVDTSQPLNTKNVVFLRDRVRPYTFDGKALPIDVYLGIDIGSVSTNFVLIDDDSNIVHEIYVYTQARPIEVVNAGLKEIQQLLGDKIVVRGVGTTGSGRELIGELTGADVIKDEITAHKTGAMYISKKLLDAQVDTIFEIGGQDSKFISLEDGVVTDFAMNEACAAGTGSFLEEQAEKLGIRIKVEFAQLAMQSRQPIKLGERCTVFMEKDINAYVQMGSTKEDIAAGLAYSIALNYLNRVVRGRRIGETIYFQGGTAYNDSVAAAFSLVLGKPIIVPPHNGVVGAIGAAILAREKIQQTGEQTAFRGFSLDAVDYTVRHFTCRACSNYCDMQEIKVDSEKTFWGDKCSDKFRKKSRANKKPVIPNLYDLREQWLLESYREPGSQGVRIGLARSMHFYEKFPFWNAYFTSLGFQVVISDPTNSEIAKAGIETTVAEPCYPIKIAHGHFKNLLDKGVDFVFQPNMINAETPFPEVKSHHCPWTQTLPFVLRSAAAFEAHANKILSPELRFRLGPMDVTQALYETMRRLGVSRRRNEEAVRAAYAVQKHFQERMLEAGREALRTLEVSDEMAILLVGRVYNLNDRGVNLNVPNKLRDVYGINVIPMDFVDASSIDIADVNPNMFWNSGRKILQIAKYIRGRDHLHLIYITNFKCGPDSYIKHYVADASGKPFLTLQLDGHQNDAGVMTRCEAYLDSKGFFQHTPILAEAV